MLLQHTQQAHCSLSKERHCQRQHQHKEDVTESSVSVTKGQWASHMLLRHSCALDRQNGLKDSMLFIISLRLPSFPGKKSVSVQPNRRGSVQSKTVKA